MSRTRRILAATLAAVAFSAVLAARQRPTFKSSVDTVEVHVTVRGQDGELIRGLTKDDFELFDNGKRQEITVFFERRPRDLGGAAARSQRQRRARRGAHYGGG